MGGLRAEVGSDHEDLTLRFDGLLTGGDVVTSTLLTNADLGLTGVRLIINSGRSNENVMLNMRTDGTYTCSLSGSSEPMTFTLDSAAAKVEVRVKTGYDSRAVRMALQRALDSL